MNNTVVPFRTNAPGSNTEPRILAPVTVGRLLFAAHATSLSCTVRVLRVDAPYVEGDTAGSCTLLYDTVDPEKVVGFESASTTHHLGIMHSTGECMLETLLILTQTDDLLLLYDLNEEDRGSLYAELLDVYKAALDFVWEEHPVLIPDKFVRQVLAAYS